MENFFFVAVIFSALLLNPWSTAFLALCVAASLVAPGAASISAFFPAFLLLIAIPSAAYIAGIMLDEYCELKLQGPLGLLALSLGTLFMFTQGFVFKALGALMSPGIASMTSLLLSAISSVTGAASLIALCFMLVPATYELPLAWALGRSSYRFPFRVFRPILILFSFSLSFHLVGALLLRELGK